MKKIFLATALILAAVYAQAETLTMYTDRPASRIQPIAAQFKAQTGVDLNIVELSYTDIVKRIDAEGVNSPVDLIFTKDIMFLAHAKNAGLFQTLTNASVKSAVAPAMKDKDNQWVAVTFRGRTLVYDPSRVNPSEISNYEDLADAKWAGRVCLRTSKGTYNVSLIASFVHHKGEAAAKNIMSGILDNLAADVFPNDTSMMTAIANGICDIGVANTYYLGQMLAQNPNFPIKPLFANQTTTGMHVNGSGIGVAKNSKNAALAQEFIALMFTEANQLAMSADHMDYPAAVGVTPNTLIKDWGTFKADAANWADIGEQVPAALRIIKELDYK
ncbi:putative binding protein component of ABC iron transporter precursor [compost metagenome]